MKIVWRLLGLVAIVAVGVAIFKLLRQNRQDNVFEMPPAGQSGGGYGSGEKRTISPELLEILADPADKGPVELITDGNGKEWLLNPRNGYRYPVEDGIPIMLIEEGEKNQDPSLVREEATASE
ncbi:MAG: hypothetical protein HC837_09935 [Chloroflexaceae bacterium]|nr:hypothetical protein [Chloroflexaceae bacterium]